MAFDQKSGFPGNTKSAIPSAAEKARALAEKEAALAKKADKKGKGPLVAVGVALGGAAIVAGGIFALSRGGGETPDPNATQPTATAPATPNATGSTAPTSEAPKPVSSIELPIVSNEGLDIIGLAQAQEIADATQRGTATPLEPFVAAANGDSSMLDAMHIDINEVVVNYQLNALYLEKAKGLVGQAVTENSVNSSNYDLSSLTGNYEFTRASQYVLGEIITQYAEGKQPQLDTKYKQCVGITDLDAALPSGGTATGMLPGLGIASLVSEAYCPENDTAVNDATHLFADTAKYNVGVAEKVGMPTLIKLAKVESSVSNLVYPEAKAFAAEFQKNIAK